MTGRTPDFDTLVIGAGVIGLAAARALALDGRSVLVLERSAIIGSETSSRHSEVIHAGLYYAPGSWKARLCAPGRRALVAYLQDKGIAHRLLGKLIVAASEAEEAALEDLLERGRTNDVEGLALLTGAQASALEPALRVRAALHSPVTGIFDSHAYMLALQGDLEAAGGDLALLSTVESIERAGDLWRAHVTSQGEAMSLCVRRVVNAAGHGAQALARRVEGYPETAIPAQGYSKGCYAALAGPCPFRRLIYPAPSDHGLGIHLTLDLAGRARFGPNHVWSEAHDTHVSAEEIAGFGADIARWWPDVPRDALHADYAGLRPKLYTRDTPAAERESDFRIDGPQRHGLRGHVHLFGIESPGLTASLALGEEIVRLLSAED